MRSCGVRLPKKMAADVPAALRATMHSPERDFLCIFTFSVEGYSTGSTTA